MFIWIAPFMIKICYFDLIVMQMLQLCLLRGSMMKYVMA